MPSTTPDGASSPPTPKYARKINPADCSHTFPVQGKMESISCRWCHLPFTTWADSGRYAHGASPKDLARYVAARQEHVNRIGNPTNKAQLDEIRTKLGLAEPKAPRRFYLVRSHDVTGVSGTGRVVEGIEFSDGTVAYRWMSSTPITSQADTIEYLISVHGHGGTTEVEWLDD